MSKFAFFFLIILSLNLYAQFDSYNYQAQPLKCSNPAAGTMLLYVNGQENRDIDSFLGLDRIKFIIESEELELKQKIDSNSMVKFDYIFNPTQGLAGTDALADFMESGALILQNDGLTPNQSWYLMNGLFRLLIAVEDLKGFFDEDYEVSNDTLELVYSDWEEFLRRESEVSDDLAKKVRTHLVQNKNKIIMISHSQGNLFVNKFYDKFVTTADFSSYKEVIGNAQIATPADRLKFPKSNYITNNEDAILKVGNIPAYEPLRGNFQLISPGDTKQYSDFDFKNKHGILTCYLYGKSGDDSNSEDLAGKTIQNWIDVAAKLASNCIELIAHFTWTDLAPGSGQLKFDASSSTGQNPLKYYWYFGDELLPAPPTETYNAEITHTYNKSGTYEVSLYVENALGKKSLTFSEIIEVEAPDNRPKKCGGAAGRYLNSISEVFIADTARDTVSPLSYLAGDIEICGITRIEPNARLMLQSGSLRLDSAIIESDAAITGFGNLFLGEGATIKQGVGVYLKGTTEENKLSLEMSGGSTLSGILNILGASASVKINKDSNVGGQVYIEGGKMVFHEGAISLMNSVIYQKGDNTELDFIKGVNNGRVDLHAEGSGQIKVVINQPSEESLLGNIEAIAVNANASISINGAKMGLYARTFAQAEEGKNSSITQTGVSDGELYAFSLKASSFLNWGNYICKGGIVEMNDGNLVTDFENCE